MADRLKEAEDSRDRMFRAFVIYNLLVGLGLIFSDSVIHAVRLGWLLLFASVAFIVADYLKRGR